MHSHDKTMIGQFVQDPDRKKPEHEMACRYLAQQENAKRLLLAALKSGGVKAKYGLYHDGDWTGKYEEFSYEGFLESVGDRQLYTSSKEMYEKRKHQGVPRQFEWPWITDSFVEESDRVCSAPRFEFHLIKGEGKYATTVGFLDLTLDFWVTCVTHKKWSKFSPTIKIFPEDYEGECPYDDDSFIGPCHVVFEVKTSLTSVSDVLRQIGLYRQYHQADAWVLATTYPLSKADRQVLANEKVVHIELSQAFRDWCKDQSVIEDMTVETQDAKPEPATPPTKTPPTKLQVAEGILAWLACAKVGIKLNSKGQPTLRFPDPPDPDIDVQEVIAEIKPYREELIALLKKDDPVITSVGLPWRPYIAKWDVQRRKAWGELANELEGTQGLSWHEAERVAYETICETFKIPTGRK